MVGELTLAQMKQCKNSHKLRYRSGMNGGQIGCAVNLNTHLLTSPEPIMVGLISRHYPYSRRGLTTVPGVLIHTACSAFCSDTWARGERRAMEMAHPGDIRKFGRCNTGCYVFILTCQKEFRNLQTNSIFCNIFLTISTNMALCWLSNDCFILPQPPTCIS